MRVFAGRWLGAGEGARGDCRTLADERVGEIPVRRVVLPAGASKWMRLRFHRCLAHDVARSPEPPAVVQLLTLSTWAAPWLGRIRAQGIRLVYTHTMVSDPALGGWRKRFDMAAFRWVDCTVASSTAMRDQLVRDGMRGRVEVIPNGVDLERFRSRGESDRKALRAQLDLPVDAELIVFVGGFLSERKGIDLLADAWGPIAARHPRAHLVLVGPHRDEVRATEAKDAFLARVRRSLVQSGADDRVIMTGKVDNVEDYLAVADVFVFPSRREGMPNVVAEAYACGVATVLTPFVGFPVEFGEAGRQHLLVDHDAAQIAEAVNALLADPDRRAALGRSGRAWAERELALDRSLDLYTELYRELGRGPGHTDPVGTPARLRTN